MFEFFAPLGVSAANNLNPVTLAFVGDAVYSLYVRQKLSLSADYKPAVLQKMSSELVSAHGQNALLKKVEGLFSAEERAVFMRGRNAKKPSHSKNADIAEYNNSTGLEAVLGWLYLTGQNQRLMLFLEGAE